MEDRTLFDDDRMAIIHKPFKYTPALHTDISVTIRREKARLKAQADAEQMAAANLSAKVTVLPKHKAQSSTS